MAKINLDEVEIHPVIAAQEEVGEQVVELHGYIGTGSENTLAGESGSRLVVRLPR